FLAIGLCLGIAVGAALLDLVRARPAPREVRLTITRNALPEREAAIDLEQAPLVERVPIRVARGVDPAYAAIGQADEPAMVGAVAVSAAARRSGDAGTMSEGRTAVAMADDEGTMGMSTASSGVVDTQEPSLGAALDPDDPCAAQRRLAGERCAVAERAKEQAEAAAANLRNARREYDDVARRIDEAHQRTDPRAVGAAKEAARQAFRSAREAASVRADLELAATIWLTEINRINLSTRDASLLIAREQSDAALLLSSIERQALEADAARITAEAAEEACAEAQAALAACAAGDRQAAAGPSTAPSPVPLPAASWDREGRHQPEIVRLLRGETAARERLVAQLAGTDTDEQRRFQLWLSELVDAIFAASIETAVLDFPDEHPFWSAFDRTQSRDITVALASLGYRFDGLGGFASERVPGQRELALAVGYAALDPMRIRQWPTVTEMPDLFHDVTVAADEFLAMRAPDLDLGEMVAVLGRRSEQLSELWNRWAQVRPLLLSVTE
ncbi:MAG TPA: hypothetical protein VMT36_01245, partial [Candidatus Saccharimonadia bacterium]|nr:hypothetical protein [Candidatus Saccharimonadia bacterium]